MFSAPPRGRKRVVPEGSEQVAAGHEGLRPDRPRRGAALSQARGKHKQGRHERVVRHPSRRLRVDAVAHGSARRRQRSPLDDRRQSRVKRWRCRRATCAREEFVDLAERQRANCSRAGKRAAFLVSWLPSKSSVLQQATAAASHFYVDSHCIASQQRANAPRTALKNSRPKSTKLQSNPNPDRRCSCTAIAARLC